MHTDKESVPSSSEAGVSVDWKAIENLAKEKTCSEEYPDDKEDIHCITCIAIYGAREMVKARATLQPKDAEPRLPEAQKDGE